MASFTLRHDTAYGPGYAGKTTTLLTPFALPPMRPRYPGPGAERGADRQNDNNRDQNSAPQSLQRPGDSLTLFCRHLSLSAPKNIAAEGAFIICPINHPPGDYVRTAVDGCRHLTSSPWLRLGAGSAPAEAGPWQFRSARLANRGHGAGGEPAYQQANSCAPPRGFEAVTMPHQPAQPSHDLDRDQSRRQSCSPNDRA